MERPAANSTTFKTLPGLFEVVAIVTAPGQPGPSMQPVQDDEGKEAMLAAIIDLTEKLEKANHKLQQISNAIADIMEANNTAIKKGNNILKENGLD